MQSFEDVLREFEDFLQTASYLEVLPCRWGYVRLFNEGAPINFYAVLCRTPQELYDTLENDLAMPICNIAPASHCGRLAFLRF